jgi:Cys-rich repeat protein
MTPHDVRPHSALLLAAALFFGLAGCDGLLGEPGPQVLTRGGDPFTDAPCVKEDDCPLGMTCDAHGGKCEPERTDPAPDPGPPCTRDRDCARGKVCSPERNRCEPWPGPCTRDQHCPVGTVCLGGTCGTGSALPDAATPCTHDTDCPDDGMQCDDGLCHTPPACDFMRETCW